MIMITTILAILNAKNLIPGILTVSNAIQGALPVWDLIPFNVTLVMTLIINFTIEEQSALKHAGTESCWGIMTVMTGT